MSIDELKVDNRSVMVVTDSGDGDPIVPSPNDLVPGTRQKAIAEGIEPAAMFAVKMTTLFEISNKCTALFSVHP